MEKRIAITYFVLGTLLLQTGYAQQRPNIIFIFVDDMGYYDLSSYGATEVQTTHIDRLAAEGIRFTDYYAAAPICSPSRAGLLTGSYPRRVGHAIWVHRPDSPFGLHSTELTLGELFQQSGYATACIGKWHLGFEEPFLPHNQGFDHYFGLLHNLDRFETPAYEAAGGTPILRNGEVAHRPADPAKLTELYTNEAIAWMDQHRDEPFFLYLPHTMLHHPLGVSKAFEGSSNWGLYGDAIHELDHHVGRMMDKLSEWGIANNTVVIYASDNGRQPGRNADQPIRGSKLTTLEGGIRVPCIAWGPGVGIQSGVESNALVHAMDWYPTLASFGGIEVPDSVVIDGRDLSGYLTGAADGIAFSPATNGLNAAVPFRRYWEPTYEWRELVPFTREEYINAFFYHGSQGALSAVRSGRWKLFLHPSYTLYDLESDPGETTPVRNREMIAKLRGMAVHFQEEMRQTARPPGTFKPGN